MQLKSHERNVMDSYQLICFHPKSNFNIQLITSSARAGDGIRRPALVEDKYGLNFQDSVEMPPNHAD